MIFNHRHHDHWFYGNWLLSSVWSGLCPSLAPLPRRRSSARWISGTTRWGEVVSCPMPSNVQGGRTTHITKIELLNPGLWDEARWRQAPRTEVPLPPHWHGGLCDHWSSSVFTTITITITIVMIIFVESSGPPVEVEVGNTQALGLILVWWSGPTMQQWHCSQ